MDLLTIQAERIATLITVLGLPVPAIGESNIVAYRKIADALEFASVQSPKDLKKCTCNQ
jgi:hypothetical protein